MDVYAKGFKTQVLGDLSLNFTIHLHFESVVNDKIY